MIFLLSDFKKRVYCCNICITHNFKNKKCSGYHFLIITIFFIYVKKSYINKEQANLLFLCYQDKRVKDKKTDKN